jgi:Type VI secretion system/phage-baseplate injector OB domain
MVTGYGGTYRGAVVDDADPIQENRLGIVVPEVYGDGVSVWAAASQTSGGSLPAVGDMVWVSFEHGDSDYPVWEAYSDTGQAGDATSGYIGKYRAGVIDNDDPIQENRLLVLVPEVDPSTIWATPAGDVRYNETPDVGAEVWVEYEYGDPAYPRWVGLA